MTFVLAIMKPISAVTTTVTTTAVTTISQATTVTGVFGPPPTRILGYFTGCPSPAIPFLKVPAPVITRIVERCNIRPPWVRVIPRWSVVPARGVITSSRAF